jgi:hypothetical protein
MHGDAEVLSHPSAEHRLSRVVEAVVAVVGTASACSPRLRPDVQFILEQCAERPAQRGEAGLASLEMRGALTNREIATQPDVDWIGALSWQRREHACVIEEPRVDPRRARRSNVVEWDGVGTERVENLFDRHGAET